MNTSRKSALKTPFAVILSASTLFIFTHCKQFQGATASVRPNPLEVHGDSVRFTVKGTIPPKSGFKKGGSYVGKLVIRGESKEYDASSMTAAEDKFPNIRKEGANITHSASVKFEEGMDGGKLFAVNRYIRKNKTKELPDVELAPCCITTSRLRCSGQGGNEDSDLILSKFEYEKSQPITLDAKFQFPQNVFEIQPTEYEKQDIKAIGEFLTKKYTATRIRLEGFASPEGTYRRNQFLSINRSKEVQKWLLGELQKQGYTVQLDSSFFQITTTTEDWEGFKANLDKTTYPEDVKRQVIQIVSAGYDEDVKEKKIMALVGGADQVESILAPLRRATVVLEGNAASHTDQQIKDMLKGFASGKNKEDELATFFKKEEFLYGVSLIEEADAKKKSIVAFNKLFADDYRGNNDLGVYLLKAQQSEDALKELQAAEQKKKGDPMILNNLGVALKRLGRLEEALAKFEESLAVKKTPEASFNAGMLFLQNGQYAKAAERFDAAGTASCAKFYSSLCKLLTNDLAGAKADIETAIRKDKDSPLSYYVLAIVGARSSDATLLNSNLKRAVQLDSGLSEKAAKDLEFRRFFNNAEFRGAIQK